MKVVRQIVRSWAFVLFSLGLAWTCGFDFSLREYLSAPFWLPFTKGAHQFERRNVRRMSAAYAGMTEAKGSEPLAKLRAAYQAIAQRKLGGDATMLHPVLDKARADPSLTRREREEVELIDAKIDLRYGHPEDPSGFDDSPVEDSSLLESAKKKLEMFLQTVQTPEFRSEARGWLGRIYYLQNNQTAAGKIYLDELNRDGSNLSRETLLNSLKLTYGYDGGEELRAHLEEYFDTPEHAAFAIQLTTNPGWDRSGDHYDKSNGYGKLLPRADHSSRNYARLKDLLKKHARLLSSNTGANALALLTMRTALRMGDPPGAIQIAEAIPGAARIRAEPDFLWMLAAAQFLSHRYVAAEQPLLSLVQSRRASQVQKLAAAYALCGVYEKNRNTIEQLKYALRLKTESRKVEMEQSYPSSVEDQSVYWASSGWDLNYLLDTEAPIDALDSFVKQNPNLPDIRLIKYSLAVRLTRENRYDEAAEIYESIRALRRASRLRRLAELHEKANRTDLTDAEKQEARYQLAEFIVSHPDGIYFNDALWGGYQRYALFASSDSRLTRQEREAMIDGERKLKDDQEERWRAYLILRDVVRDAGQTDFGRKSAVLALRCLRGISERFERQEEIRKADRELSAWLRARK